MKSVWVKRDKMFHYIHMICNIIDMGAAPEKNMRYDLLQRRHMSVAVVQTTNSQFLQQLVLANRKEWHRSSELLDPLREESSGGRSILLAPSYMRQELAWLRHQMETFSPLLAHCAGNSPAPGQWRGALVFSFICVWIDSWVNNREAGDLRR